MCRDIEAARLRSTGRDGDEVVSVALGGQTSSSGPTPVGGSAVTCPRLPSDDHTHSEWSWDASAGSMVGSCARAVELGLPSIAFTEHVDVTRGSFPSRRGNSSPATRTWSATTGGSLRRRWTSTAPVVGQVGFAGACQASAGSASYRSSTGAVRSRSRFQRVEQRAEGAVDEFAVGDREPLRASARCRASAVVEIRARAMPRNVPETPTSTRSSGPGVCGADGDEASADDHLAATIGPHRTLSVIAIGLEITEPAGRSVSRVASTTAPRRHGQDRLEP